MSKAELKNGRYHFPEAEEFLRPYGYSYAPLLSATMQSSLVREGVKIKEAVYGKDGSCINEGLSVAPEHLPNLAAVVVLLTPITEDQHPLKQLVDDIKWSKKNRSWRSGN